MKTTNKKEIENISDENQVILVESKVDVTSVKSDSLLTPKKRKAPKTAFKSGAEWRGNRNGRPKGKRSFDTIANEAFLRLEEKYMKEGIPIPDFEMEIFEKIFNEARKGNGKMVELFLRYRFSQPKQEIEISGEVDTKLSPEERAKVDAVLSRWNKDK